MPRVTRSTAAKTSAKKSATPAKKTGAKAAKASAAAPAKKAPAKKAPAKAPAKKAPAKKAPVKKAAPAKKATSAKKPKKEPAGKGGRKSSKRAAVDDEDDEVEVEAKAEPKAAGKAGKKAKTDGSSVENPSVDIVFSFDMTGSMTPCLHQVRQELDRVIPKLYGAIPDLQVGLITHGDYDSSRYLTQHLDLTSDETAVRKYVVEALSAGSNCWNDGEAYEEAMALAATLTWRPAAKKVLVVIGDDIPHRPGHCGATKDWRKELQGLRSSGIQVVGVQVPTNSTARSKFFYNEITDFGELIALNQFAYITDTMVVLAYSQHSQEQVEAFEQELVGEGRHNRNLQRTCDLVLGRKSTLAAPAADAIAPGRFQTLRVNAETSIKEFVLESGATFNVGRGFYQVTKPEKVSAKKEVILQELATGDTYVNADARRRLGMSLGDATVAPRDVPKGHLAFIQSTSTNRKLFTGTLFLYEID